MTLWLSAGMLFTLLAVVIILLVYGRRTLTGTQPVSLLTFVAILFTSGLDVGLVMFPLTEFPQYADTAANPEYAFTNPLAIEFGFWGFLVWAIYFLTCFYFCAIEPRLGFFRIPLIKWLNNLVIIGTCAFTAHLLLVNLEWYLPGVAQSDIAKPVFYTIVFTTIALAVYSSTHLIYIKVFSVATTLLFIMLILLLGSHSAVEHDASLQGYWRSVQLLSDYFTHLPDFILPMNSYHSFYLFWWFAWSIMIGQFTARFVGGLKTYQVFLAMLVLPSIPIALWFATLHHYYVRDWSTQGLLNYAMVFVGVTFVLNSLDSLIRLYGDNLSLTLSRLGPARYAVLHGGMLWALTLLFTLGFMRIQWIGALVIGLFFLCAVYGIKSLRAFQQQD
ncbi:BCCT family transporter [Aestuariibacter halophilus]|uniref:BCCT family transporter n=1 Tax=Fluctibacter halophilus TaxID=226011 RepID=A0ABS8GBI1_9ALTE|nr:BCCT family transporter [Aestuariibacter halophilus]MCC2617779.1 BCCT family transporter [Aestuariibacter halophilus]